MDSAARHAEADLLGGDGRANPTLQILWPKTPAETKSTPAPANTATITLNMVTNIWRDLVNQAGEQNKNMPALLNMGKPLAIEDRIIVLGFDYPIFKEKFDNTAGAAQLLGEIATNLLNNNCTVRAVVTSEYTVPINKDDFKALADELGGVVNE